VWREIRARDWTPYFSREENKPTPFRAATTGDYCVDGATWMLAQGPFPRQLLALRLARRYILDVAGREKMQR
jgi:hypothetical protein